MVKQIFALLFVAIFLSPSFSTSVTEMCVTPVCRCSSDPSYNVTVICYTDDAMYDLKHSIKKAEEIVALYVNSYDSLFYILSSSSVSFFFVIAWNRLWKCSQVRQWGTWCPHWIEEERFEILLCQWSLLMLKKLKTFTLLQHYRVKSAQFFGWALCNKHNLIVLCWVTWSPIKTSLCLVESKSKLDTGTRTFVVQEQRWYSLKYRTKNNNRKMPNDDIVIRLK